MLTVDLRAQRGDFSLDVAFSSPPGVGILALAGASGAGKSSVLRCIAGLTRPTSGRICLGDRVLFDSDAGIDVPPHQRRIGVVFQDARLFPHLSVGENLRFGVPPGRPGAVDFDEVVRVLGIRALLSRRPRALSGGEKQRVAIGRALLSDPELLLLDEPLASLDAARKAAVLPYLRALPGRFSVPLVTVTHNLDELLQLADAVVVLEQGRVAASGSVAASASALGMAPADETLLEGQVGLVGDEGLVLVVGSISLSLLPVPGVRPGDRLRVRVRSDEVVLATGVPTGLSIQNRIPAEILALSPARGGVRVQLALHDADGPQLSALVTRAACVALGLKPGGAVTALIKASAIRAPGVRPPR